MILEKGFYPSLWSFVPSGLSQEGSNLTTLQPYDLEVVTVMTMYDAAPIGRSPLARRDRRALPWASRCCAFSAFSHPRYGSVGKDHSGVAAREIVRIAKKESAV